MLIPVFIKRAEDSNQDSSQQPRKCEHVAFLAQTLTSDNSIKNAGRPPPRPRSLLQPGGGPSPRPLNFPRLGSLWRRFDRPSPLFALAVLLALVLKSGLTPNIFVKVLKSLPTKSGLSLGCEKRIISQCRKCAGISAT
uniref:Uncharacterized protein n=1 Tax=Romanomermis culicivorax TaxID=13658 RepID=A0A915I2Y8_ROMCU